MASAEANQLVQGVTATTFVGEQYLSAFGDGGSISDWARLQEPRQSLQVWELPL